VSDGLKAPDTFLRAVALYRGEDRTADYVVLPKSLVEPVEDPAADKLAAWFEERKASYAAPEYRKIVYIKLQPEDIADEAAVSDTQVSEEYERNKARFTTPETRTIEQLVFPSTEAAQTALDSIKSGATFDSIVASQGKTQADTLLGTLSKAQVPDQAVADAAFALQVDEVSPIVQGAFGPILVRVTEIKPEVVRTLAEVTPQIRRDLALAEANRVLLDVHDDYEDSRAAGDSLVEAASKLQLKPVTVEAIDRNAQRPDGSVVTDLPESQALIAAAFESDVGVENPSIPIGGNGYVFYEIESITPARERTLDEVREKAVADWKAAEATARLSAKAAELEKRVKDGAALDTVATELGLEKQIKRGLKRESDDSEFGEPGVAAVFGVAEGGVGVFTLADSGAQVVFKVTEVFEPVSAGPDAVAEDLRKGFATGISNDLLDQLVAQLQSQFQVRVNQAAIAQAMAF
jgi:peptidyl-prolyl cis-trans isomerase D